MKSFEKKHFVMYNNILNNYSLHLIEVKFHFILNYVNGKTMIYYRRYDIENLSK